MRKNDLSRFSQTYPETRKGTVRRAAAEIQQPNSPATLDRKLSDPILHFLQLKDTRTPILKDVCKMIEERNRNGR